MSKKKTAPEKQAIPKKHEKVKINTSFDELAKALVKPKKKPKK